MATHKPGRSLRPKAAALLLGIALPTFWRWVREKDGFPKGRSLSARCRVFDEDELLRWRDAQGSAR